jgi:hypothetical protein
MRCPAIGLAEKYQADFIIVRDCTPHLRHLNCIDAKHYTQLQFATSQKNPELPFLDETFHKDITIDSVANDAESVDWSKYHIVITINACIPEHIVRRYPNTLWCYFSGENRHYMDRLIDGYHVILNQNVGVSPKNAYTIGFPYSFLLPDTLERLYAHKFGRCVPTKRGVFMEINNTQERPVRSVPNEFQYISKKTGGMPIFAHSQNIVENLKRVCESKYFVKLLGRLIRGNSVVECVSAGTLILANPRLVMYNDLIHPICYCFTPEEVIARIAFFEKKPDEYVKIVAYQRERLTRFYCENPMELLVAKYKGLGSDK